MRLLGVLACLVTQNHAGDAAFPHRLLQTRQLSVVFSRMDDLEKWNAFMLYAEDAESVPIATELYSRAASVASESQITKL